MTCQTMNPVTEDELQNGYCQTWLLGRSINVTSFTLNVQMTKEETSPGHAGANLKCTRSYVGYAQTPKQLSTED